MDGNSAGGAGAGGAGAGAGASSQSPSPCSSTEPSPSSGSSPGTATGSGMQTLGSGCGCLSHPAINAITVTVAMTTGGQFTLQVDQLESVDTLKKMASKKLRVPKERICLLYRERQLSGGTLLSHQIVNGSRLTLLPNVETGLLAQRPEQSVMQALESLNDGQVNDFLSGKAPLNLTMRFGDHMMLIQLQLSTVSPQASRSRAATASASSASSTSSAVSSSTRASSSSGSSTTVTTSTTASTSLPATPTARAVSTTRVRRASTILPGLVSKVAASSSASCPASPSSCRSGPTGDMGPPSNPPASRSTISVSAPTSPTSTSPAPGLASALASAPSLQVDPLSALPSAHACEALLSQLVDSATQAVQASASGKLGSGNSVSDTARTNLLRAIDPSYRTSEELRSERAASSSSCPSSPPSSPASPKQGSTSTPGSHKLLIRPARFLAESTTTTSNASTCTHISRSTSPIPESSASSAPAPASSCPSASCPSTPSSSSTNTKGVQTMPCSEDRDASSTSTCTCEASRCSVYRQETRVHTRALAEASRNLMQTLKQLSSEVLTNREEEDTAAARRRQGAIIESMHNHGKGVYSGTFSGTLNPALQDRFGRPKRDISTVIHILNDLLCATPQYRRSYQGLPQSNFVLEPNSSSPSSSTTPSPAETAETQSTPSQTADDAENQATRGKVERLRLVMEERRERRRARREARISPYGASQPQPQHWTAKSETQPAGKASEAMDTDQPLCDISPPEPVVA